MSLMVMQMSEVNLATIQLNGEKQSFILAKKEFKTGSRGYHAQGKMQTGEKSYQVTILCVEIGSKPKEKQK
jgi:spore maturation protein SpmB